MANSLSSHGQQPARFICAPLPPRVGSNPCPLSQWCYLTISSSIALFSSCPQSFPASGVSSGTKWGFRRRVEQLTVFEHWFGNRLFDHCFICIINPFNVSLKQVSVIHPHIPIYKYKVISYVSQARQAWWKSSFRSLWFQCPCSIPVWLCCQLPFHDCFFNSLGMAHNLQLRRCLENVHRLDDEWMNDCDKTAYRTEPWKRVSVQWPSWLPLPLGKGSIDTGKGALTSPSSLPSGMTQEWLLLPASAHLCSAVSFLARKPRVPAGGRAVSSSS